MPQIPPKIGGFSVFPVSMPALPSFPQSVTHHIYVRRNAPKIATPTDSRSLFMTNLPVDSTLIHIRGLVTSLVGAGRFENVEFEGDGKPTNQSELEPAQAARIAAHSKKRKREEDNDADRSQEEEEAARLPETWSRPLRRSGGTAVVLLADEKSIEQLLKAISKLHKTKKYPVWGSSISDRVPPLGSQWLKAHNRLTYPSKEAVQDAVDAFFTMFNRKEHEAAELAKRLRNEPDEDGFVTVTRGGRNAPARKDEAEEARRKMLERQEKKKRELTNFYRFQMRERKKAEQADLIKRFEDDKKKIAAMREKRAKFRPET